MMLRWIKYGIIAVLLMMGRSDLSAQKGTNPFDLTPRLPEKAMLDAIEEDSTQPEGLKNPFDIQRKKSNVLPVVVEVDTLPATETYSEENEGGIATAQPSDKGPFVFWLIIGILIYLSLLVTIMRPLFVYIFRAFVNDNLLSQLYREQSKGLSLPFLLLYLMFVLNVSVFVYLSLQYLGINLFDAQYKDLLAILVVFSLVVLFKHSLLVFTGWLLPAGKEIMNYNFTVVIFNIVIGIVLVPLSILIAYGPSAFAMTCIWIGVAVMILIYLFRFLRGLFISSRILLFHKFHFLLYLCAVEIAPALVFIKLLMINSGA